MMKHRTIYLIPLFIALSACEGSVSKAPVPVSVPGVPSPELALQRSIDRVHNFLDNVNGRIETPLRQSLPLATSSSRPAIDYLHVPHTPKEASPLYGKNGQVWFVFSDGYPRIECTPRATCIIHLQKGESLDANGITVSNMSDWTVKASAKNPLTILVTSHRNAGVVSAQFITSKRTYNLLLDPHISKVSMRNIYFAYSTKDSFIQDKPPENGDFNNMITQ